MKDLLPGIMRQLGPKQISFIKEYAEQLKKTPTENKETDDAPDLVPDSFEDVANQDTK